MNLRDEIARAVARAVDRALDGERAMTPPPLGDWHPLVTDAVHDILTEVREALLSNEVQAPIRQELHNYPRTSTRDTVKTVIEMALDAVTGGGGER